DTKVQLTARSNRPLSGGTIRVVAAGEPIDVVMSPGVDRQEAVGQFTISSDGRFELRVRDIQETESLESISGSITLLHDDRPVVLIIRPKPMSLATPSVNLPVEIAAEDDYGLSRLVLFRSLDDSRSLPQELPLPASPPTHYGTKVALPLSDYGLNPGDV